MPPEAQCKIFSMTDKLQNRDRNKLRTFLTTKYYRYVCNQPNLQQQKKTMIQKNEFDVNLKIAMHISYNRIYAS